MKQPIFYYQEGPKFDDYRLGPPPHCPEPPHHPHCPPCQPQPHYHGRVSIIGRTVLTVKFTDCHGHIQNFDIVEGETYEIKAISQNQGICTFAARIVDFESSKGIDKLINKPHIINVTAIIVDYSDAYESKLMRIGINNIVSIRPVRCFDGAIDNNPCDCHPYPIQPPPPPYSEPPHHHHCDENNIHNPFEKY